MPSPEMWCRVGIVITDVSDENIVSIFRAELLLKLVTLNVILSSLIIFTLKMGTCSSEMSVLTKSARRYPRIRHSSQSSPRKSQIKHSPEHSVARKSPSTFPFHEHKTR
jgi:hypothetical protein